VEEPHLRQLGDSIAAERGEGRKLGVEQVTVRLREVGHVAIVSGGDPTACAAAMR
jgi:hypothetical protein